MNCDRMVHSRNSLFVIKYLKFNLQIYHVKTCAFKIDLKIRDLNLNEL